MNKQRLDQLVVAAGLAESRAQAQRLILAGRIRIDGQPALKPGHTYRADAPVACTEVARFVSRGGEKLQAALEQFAIPVRDRVCVDIGASTGGFTDCLLQNGARQVYAVDVGKHQLHAKLRADPRVVVMEKVNARYLEPASFAKPPSVAVIDVSFISLTKVLAPVTQALAPGAHLVALIKPQFEAGRKEVGKGGVVRDPRIHEAVIERVRTAATERCGLEWIGVLESPLRGPAGNVEFLAYCRRNANEPGNGVTEP